jgi:hypothetical protein
VLIPLPCPFCGRGPEVIEHAGLALIQCAQWDDVPPVVGNSEGHSVSVQCRTLSAALAIWNTRATPAAQASTDYDAWKQAWNDNRGPLPQATKLTGERLDKLRRRIKEGLTLEDFTRAAWACSHTEFLLRGTPKQEFHATFDWLVSNSGIVAKVLDGTYGPTGKSEAELKAEAAEKEKSEAFKTHEMLAYLSVRRQQGHKLPWGGNLLRNVEEWEQEARECIARLDAGNTTIAPELVTIVRNWQKRMAEVTTDATATSGN